MSGPRLSKQEWAEQAAAKVEAAQAVLATEVEALASGEDWKRFLTFQSRLHAYSPNNVMLIYAQHARAFADGLVPTPEPTYVAGFHTWRALGRSVQKGQHSYAVLAPMTGQRRIAVDERGGTRPLGSEDSAGPGESEERRRVLRGFRVERTFEIGQTQGDPVPEPVGPQLLEGEAPPGLGAAVMRLIEERGFSVGTVPDAGAIDGANGHTDWAARRVVVRSDMDDAAIVKTLMHEAGHVVLHEGPPGRFLPRAVKEVEAESVAFVVAFAHGMSTDGYSFPYVAGWAGSDPAKAVSATQGRVAQAARVIIEASPAAHGPGGKVPGADRAVLEGRRLEAEARARRVELVGRLGAGGPGPAVA